MKTLSSTSLKEKSTTMEVRVASSEDYDKILEFIRVHYYLEEPLTIGVDASVPQDRRDEEFSMSNIEHGTSIVAVEKDDILGVFLASPKNEDVAEHIKQEAEKFTGTKWSKILEILYRCENGANVFKKFNVTKAIHGHVLAVHKGARGRNIGGQLVEKAFSVAKSKGYDLFTTDCTSYYSAKLMERLEMTLVHKLAYKDYTDSNGKQVFNPPEIHESIMTFAKKL